MSVDHEIQIIRRNGATSVSKTIAITSGSAIRVDEDFSNGNNQPFDIDFVNTKLQYLWALSSTNMTVEFNNSTTGVPTLTLVAGEPLLWEKRTETLLPNPFSETVTTAFVTCAAPGNLKIDGLVDPT